MSKAFTKEDDGGDEPLPPYVPPWPAGRRNYITRAGHGQLRAERDALVAKLGAPVASDAAGQRELNRRLAIVDAHLAAAEIVVPPASVDRVQFATVVTVEGHELRSYAIVGVDEVEGERGRISWLSPIARALQGRRVGDEVQLRSPRGSEDVTVVSIEPLLDG